MPNWVKNIIKFKKKGNENLLKEILNDKGYFDFNKIIPMPKELEIESSSYGDTGLILLYSHSNLSIYNKETINEAFKTLNYFNSDIRKEYKYKHYKNFDENKFSKEEYKSIELAKKYVENYIKYGHCNWYSWANSNWNTKWNAYENKIIETKRNIIIIFDTAWSCPFPIFEKLAEKYDFEVRYADEDIGNNCGKFKYSNKTKTEYFLNNPRDFARRLWKY